MEFNSCKLVHFDLNDQVKLVLAAAASYQGYWGQPLSPATYSLGTNRTGHYWPCILCRPYRAELLKTRHDCASANEVMDTRAQVVMTSSEISRRETQAFPCKACSLQHSCRTWQAREICLGCGWLRVKYQLTFQNIAR